MNKQLVVFPLLLAGLFFSFFRVTAATSEQYEDRAELLINQVADTYAPPNMNIGDPEKYYWPKAMARFHKYGINDETANYYIEQIGTKGAFHFAVVGMTRLLCQFADAPQMQTSMNAILQKNLMAGLTTSEGTENHLCMERTSIFLISQLALEKDVAAVAAQKSYDDSKAWILAWSKRVYQQGIGEWNSSIYAAYSLLGWLNLYDFSKDAQVKAAAKAVADYYAAEIALHYSWGSIGGSELRGNAETDKNYTATAYLGWLWFGTTGTFPQDFKNADYIQSVHAVLTTYRPSEQIVELARKDKNQRVWFQNSKASYLYEEQSYCKQDFYISDNFTLGNLVCGYGGYTGASNQIVPWRLMIRNGNLPHQIGGGGRFRNNWSGQGREPFTQTAQYKNTLILLSKLPADLTAHINKVTAIVNQWKIDWATDYYVRQYTKDNVVGQTDGSNCAAVSYISVPNTLNPVIEGKKAYIDAGDVYLVLSFLHTPTQSTDGSRKILKDTGSGSELTGYVLEVIEKTDVASLDALKAATKDIDITLKNDASITYTTQDGNALEVTFIGEGTCMEPLYDWGYGTQEKMCLLAAPPLRQPDWGIADGFGKIPAFKVNNVETDYSSIRPVYDGSLFTLGDGIMLIKTTDAYYKVDYTGDTPEWSEIEPTSSAGIKAVPPLVIKKGKTLYIQTEDDTEHQFGLYDLTGKQWASRPFKKEINAYLPELAPGIYIVCIDNLKTKIAW